MSLFLLLTVFLLQSVDILYPSDRSLLRQDFGGQVERSDEFEIDEEYLIRNYTVEDGLPVNAVGRKIQDDDGYIWTISLDGLIRYDGYDFRIYNSGNTPGLNSNRISGIEVTEKNEFWLLHTDGSLTYRNGSSFTPYSNNIGNFPGSAWRITADSNGQFWAVSQSEVFSFHRENQTFEKIESPLLQSEIFALQAVGPNQVFVLNKDGLILIDHMHPELVLSPNQVKGNVFSYLTGFKRMDNRLWLVGLPYALRYSLTNRRPEMILHFQSVTDFVVTNLLDGSTWPVTITEPVLLENLPEIPGLSKSELLRLLPASHHVEYESSVLNGDYPVGSIHAGRTQLSIHGQIVLTEEEGLREVLVDREGSVWVSSQTKGIFQIRKSMISNIDHEDIPGFENIYSVIESGDGTITACGFTANIYQIKENNVIRWGADNSELPGTNCRSLFEDPNGTLYAGLWGEGLWRFQQNSWKQVPVKNEMLSADSAPEVMHIDKKGRFLVGTRNRMFILEDDSLRLFSENTDRLRGVRVIRENENGDLYFGTRGNGLIVHRNSKEKLQLTSSNSGLSSDLIRDIYFQSRDTLWLATENLGLNRLIFDRSGTLVSSSSVSVEDGLISNSTHRIIQTPDNYLWISSNGGIMRISLDELNQYADGQLKNLSVLAINESDGMINREANGGVQTAGLLANDGRIWFPNQNGITVINPASIARLWKFPLPKPVIEQVSFTDSSLAVYHQPEVTIPKGNRNIRIKFTAPNSYSPDHIRFRYKLEGVNLDWENDTGNREAVLTNIAPGTHEFNLAVHRDGNASEIAEASVLITVPYYFYETAWFKILLGLLGLLALFGSIKYRTRVLEERERKLQERVDRQTLELKEASEQKSRFFSGITHELKTPLSLIASPLEDLMENPKEISEETVQNRLELMHRNSRKLQYLVDQILDVTRLNSDAMRLTIKPVDIPELTRQIAGQFHSMLEMEEIELVFESDPIDELVYADPDAWEHIVINLLSNAIRFSPQGSSIYITLKNKHTHVTLKVKDEGIGIDDSEQQKVFEYLYQVEGNNAAEGTGIGLYLVKGLVKCLGGSIELVSQKGEGAEFIITLKKGYSHFRESDTIVHEPFIVTPIHNGKSSRIKPVSPDQKSTVADAGHIMIVEDNHDYRNYLQSLISKYYKVTAASEGKEALGILKNTNVSLVISDVMMPGMNGFEFVHTLRKKEAYKHLPVVFLSAKNQEVDMEAGLSTGADIYLTKPIKSSLLLSQIAAVLRREEVLKTNQLVSGLSEEDELVKNLREMIYRQLANPGLNINMLADSLFMSRSSLYREWKKVSEISLNDFIKQVRLQEAKFLLENKEFSVQQAAAAVGYADASYFSNSFKKEFGVSPSGV